MQPDQTTEQSITAIVSAKSTEMKEDPSGPPRPILALVASQDPVWPVHTESPQTEDLRVQRSRRLSLDLGIPPLETKGLTESKP